MTSTLREKVRKELRVKPQPARDLAAKVGVPTHQIATAIGQLVKSGEAVRHPGATGRGDRSPTYSRGGQPTKKHAARATARGNRRR